MEELHAIVALRNNRHLKEDGSYVTEADLLIDRLVTDYIQRDRGAYAVISEERTRGHADNDPLGHYIVLDPLDGTENFTSGLKEWGVGISVFSGGRHVESAILLPELREQLVTGDSIEYFESRIHGLSSSLQKDDLALIEAGFEYRIMGCSMYNMFNVIRGSYRVFENVKGVYCWDILPGLNLALEHGCRVEVNGVEYDGAFLPPDNRYRVKVRHG